jgi:hypothetical protein
VPNGSGGYLVHYAFLDGTGVMQAGISYCRRGIIWYISQRGALEANGLHPDHRPTIGHFASRSWTLNGPRMNPPILFDLRRKRIYVAGPRGMVGSAIVRRLADEDCEILTAQRKAVDLTDQGKTEKWLAENRPDAVFLAAGLVGGIHANKTYPADFMPTIWRSRLM